MRLIVRRAIPVVLAASLAAAGVWEGGLYRSASAGQGGATSAPAARNVILVMVDGLRLQESYKFDQFTSPYFPQVNYTPRLTTELIPQGTLYTDAKTGVFNTITTSCVNTMVTGAWNDGPNRGRGAGSSDEDYVDNRTFDRTLFEMARTHLRLPEEKVAYFTDKLNTRLSNYSYHPQGGPGEAPTTVAYVTRFNEEEPIQEETYIDPLHNSDRDVFQTALDAMDSVEPRLMFLCFGNVDIAGHRSIAQEAIDYNFYADSIRVWDDLIANFWQEVQSRPAYRDKTTLVICSDHGRHDDHDELAYGNHSGTCNGTRDLLLLVLGPDTPQGLSVGRRAYQSAVAPTVARALGMPLPEATGQPLYEALSLAPGSGTRPYLRDMRAASDGSGTLYAVYRAPDASGNDRIVVQRARPGRDFDAPVAVSAVAWDSPVFYAFPDIAVDEHGVHVVAWRWTEDNHDYVSWTSTDGGQTFSDPPVKLIEGKREDVPTGQMTLRRPRLFSLLGKEHVIAPTVAFPSAGNASLLVRLEYEEMGNLLQKVTEDSIPDHRRVGHQKWIAMGAGGAGDLYASYGALQLPTDPNTQPMRATWEIFFKNFSQTTEADPALRLTDDNAVPFVMPAMAVDPADDSVHLVYAGLVNGVFQLYYRRSLDADKTTWSAPVVLTQSGGGAWEPSIGVVEGVVQVVYTGFRGGEGDIYQLTLAQGTVVSGPANVSFTRGISRNPQLLWKPGALQAEVVWEEQDLESGEFHLARRMLFR